MSKLDVEIEITPDADYPYRVVFGRRLACGEFQVSYSKPAAYFKTEAGAKRAVDKWMSK